MSSFTRSVIFPLGELAGIVADLDVDDLLYVEGRPATWTVATPCAIVYCDQYEEEAEELTIGGVLLWCTLSSGDISEIVDKLNDASASGERFVAAIAHYHEYDSFILD